MKLSHLTSVNIVWDPKNVHSFLNINWFEWWTCRVETCCQSKYI